ncbi:MAG TPA: ArsA-related P-loop ATPase [Kofleriaceae bacterium]|nr:ArsA-related P-loop ATPase [Kofleriaceae bacterium]
MRTSRTLHYVTGKGGVGKSTIAAALALDLAARGARVLALELGASPAGLCRVLGTKPPEAGAIVRVAAAPGVSLAYFDGAAALGEYLTRRMHLGRLGRHMMQHPLYRGFVTAAPGVRELLVIGKIRDELVLQKDGLRPRWDAIVVDAGASGHALEHLRMPQAAASTFKSGLVHREAEVNAELLRDPRRCAVHLVATPEELPLREAAQVIASLRELKLPVGAVIVNQCRPVAPPTIDDAIARVHELTAPPAHAERVAWLDARAALAGIGARARSWERIQERGIAALEAEAGVTTVRVPRLWVADGLDQAAALAAAVGEAAR